MPRKMVILEMTNIDGLYQLLIITQTFDLKLVPSPYIQSH